MTITDIFYQQTSTVVSLHGEVTTDELGEDTVEELGEVRDWSASGALITWMCLPSPSASFFSDVSLAWADTTGAIFSFFPCQTNIEEIQV